MYNMSIKLSDFLLQHFRQLHFDNMPVEARAQFDGYVKAEDFRGNMKSWRDNLTHLDGGKRVNNALPDGLEPDGKWELDRDEWQKFFLAFQHAFQAMSAKKSAFKDNKKATEFLDEWFGTDKLFDITPASPAVQAEITNLAGLLQRHRNIMIMKLREWGLINADFSFQDLIDGIRDKKYNKDVNFQERLKNIAQYITSYASYDPTFAAQLNGENTNFSGIEDGFDDTRISPQKMGYFQAMYPSLLRHLYKTPKALEVFAEYDKGVISKPLTTAKAKVDYANAESDDYVPPKRTDELTLGQQIKKWRTDTYEDVLEKFVKLRGDRMYFSPSAKQIVSAIGGAKIKPTDGLAPILDKANDIKDKLKYKSPAATEAFDYFVKVMKDLKATMPKAFAGALYNASQRRRLVEEMIIRAVREGKENLVKPAMEVLSVIRYGWTTSKVMDALGKEEFKLFSDPSLSWNKNEGMKFVTAALDKSLKTAFMGLGYGITIAKNAIVNRGDKFNGKSDRIAAVAAGMDKQNAAYRDAYQTRGTNNDAMQANLDATAAERDAAKLALDNARHNRAMGNRRVAMAKKSEKRLGRQFDAQGNVLTTEQKTANALQANIDALEHESEQLKIEIDAANRMLEQYEEMMEVRTLDSNLTAYEMAVKNWRYLTGNLDRRVEALKDTPIEQIPEKQAEIDRLRGEAAKAAAAMKRYAQMLDEPEQPSNLTHKKRWELRDKHDAVLKHYHTLIRDLASKNRLLGETKGQLAQVQKKIDQQTQLRAQQHQNALDRATAEKRDALRASAENKDAFYSALDTYNEKVSAFNAARDNIEIMNSYIEHRDQELEKMDTPSIDKYRELMAHWDFLETGRNVHSWALSKKKAQAKLDAKIEQANGKKIAQRDLLLKNYYDAYQQKYAA